MVVSDPQNNLPYNVREKLGKNQHVSNQIKESFRFPYISMLYSPGLTASFHLKKWRIQLSSAVYYILCYSDHYAHLDCYARND